MGKNIIRKVLSNEGVIGDRCRILATNSVPVLHEASDIYLLSGGSIVEHGDFDAVMSRDGDLATLIKEYGRKKDDSSSTEEGSSTTDVPSSNAKPSTQNEEESSVDVKETGDLVDEIVEYVGEENRGVVEGAVLRRASVVSYGHNYEDDEDSNGEPRKTRQEEEVSRKGLFHGIFSSSTLLHVTTSTFRSTLPPH